MVIEASREEEVLEHGIQNGKTSYFTLNQIYVFINFCQIYR